MMKSVFVKEIVEGNKFEVQFVENVAIPIPKNDELLLKVHSASINPVDTKYHLWAGLASVRPLNQILGVDAAGEVIAVGDDAKSGWAVGDRVVCHVWLGDVNGTFAEYCTVKAKAAVRIPSNDISYSDAAATPCAGWTSFKAFRNKFKIPALLSYYQSQGKEFGLKNKSIFITGGNGGVGGFALQLAKHYRFGIIITTCSASANERVRRLGATHTIDYREVSNTAEAILSIVPTGVDYIIDCISGASITSLLPALAHEGEAVQIGGVGVRGNPGDHFLKSWSIHDISLGATPYMSGKLESLAEIGQEFMELMSQGHIDSMIEYTITLEEVPHYMELIAASKCKGKVVVNM